MDIPKAVCKKLAGVNPDYRYGIGWIPGQGQTIFLALLVDRIHGGSDNQEQRHLLVTHVRDLGERLIRLYDTDGSLDCRVPSDKAAVIISWPGQAKNIGNAAVIAGDHADWLIRNGRPQEEVDDARVKAARENGREIDSYVEGAADELADMWRFWGNKEMGRDRLFDKEDTKRAWNSPQGREWQKTHEHAKEGSFEEFCLVENGHKV